MQKHEDLNNRAYEIMKYHYMCVTGKVKLTLNERLEKAEKENDLYADLFSAGRGDDVQMIVQYIASLCK